MQSYNVTLVRFSAHVAPADPLTASDRVQRRWLRIRCYRQRRVIAAVVVASQCEACVRACVRAGGRAEAEARLLTMPTASSAPALMYSCVE